MTSTNSTATVQVELEEPVRKEFQATVESVWMASSAAYHSANRTTFEFSTQIKTSVMNRVSAITAKVVGTCKSTKAKAASIYVAARTNASSLADRVQSSASRCITPVVMRVTTTYTSVKVRAYGITEHVYGVASGYVTQVTTKAGQSLASAKARALEIKVRVQSMGLSYIDPLRTKAADLYASTKMKALGLTERFVTPVYVGAMGRVQNIRDTYVVPVTTKTIEVYVSAKDRAIKVSDQATARALLAADSTKARVVELGSNARVVASEPKTHVAAAAATGGAVALGASGGATGLAAGGAIGAAVGVIPALFTFGLSIPIGAAIGGGAGLCVGVTVGSTVGFIGGGAAGCSAYSRRDSLRSGALGAWKRASDCSGSVKERARSSASYLKQRLARGAVDGA